MARVSKFIILFIILTGIAFFTRFSYCDEKADVAIEFIDFFPDSDLKKGVPFQIIFRIKNTGDGAINPFAEVTLSGNVYDANGDLAIRLTDKKYNVYNLWPGEQSGKLWFYVGVLEEGSYKLKLNVNGYNRAKKISISNDIFELDLNVEE